MRKLLAIVTLLVAWVQAAQAQDFTISGKVTETQSGAAVEMATVRLMKSDSTFVTGASSAADGSFKVNAKKTGSYILKFTFIGYNTVYRNVTLTKENPTANVGTIKMGTNDRLMKEATVKAHVAKVQIVKDTFIYNVAAYRVPEGSTLEALIDQLPGAVVDDNGGITINGKTVSEIRVDGKDFFKGDTKVAMKNLPVSLIDKVKAYDMKSDYTRETGIDDGNDKTVLDLQMKQKLKSSWISNLDLAYGNHDRYSSRLFITRFTDVSNLTFFGSMNNVGDRGFRGGGPGFRGGGGSGLTASKMFGLNGFWKNDKKEDEAGYFQINGNARFNHSNTDAMSRSNSETFLNTGTSSSFSNNAGHNYSKSTGVNLEMNVRWKPDTMTTVYARPSYSHSESKSHGESLSATFNSDPYDVVDNPLDSMFFSNTAINIPTSLAAIAVNRNRRLSLSKSNSDSYDINAGVTRRLNKKGRSVSLDGGASYSRSNSHSWSINDIYYFQNARQTYNNQYSLAPSKSWGYNARLSYSEPIVKNLFFQGSYNFQYRYQDRDRSLYQLDSLAEWGVGNTHQIGQLPEGDVLNTVLNMENSQYATYKDYIHSINLGFRYVTTDLNFSVGIRLQPQHTALDYKKNQLDTTVTRNVFNVAPNVRLRWNITRYERLELRYRGSSSQPSMTDLLDVTDTSDPLHISMGNPNLKPSWTNNFNAYYNKYWTELQRSINFNVSFSQTSNSISNAVLYDEATGVRTTRPENINGNWNTNGDVMFNTGFGSDKQFNFMSHTNASYSHNVGYISTDNTNSQKNTVRNLNLGERTRLSYRNDYFEAGLNGSVNYSHARSKLQSRSDLDTWTFAYGGSLQFNSTWNMTISTDIAMNSRRGFNDASMNTNELIWNAQITQSFLKNNNLTLSLQFYDLLHEQSNISRSINSIARTDSWSNGIYSYFMFHLIYRFNVFAGVKGASGGMGPGGGRRGGGGPGRGFGGGPR